MADVQFYFAWVNPDETTFDPSTMAREDEDVFSFTMSQQEGDFASLDLAIKNPRVGFLAPGRKVWAWFSYSVNGADAVPLFFGRLLGVPTNIFDTVVNVTFTARPLNFNEQKLALAASLRVKPYWDDIFISPDKWDDPDVVLEARTQIWHVDPVTHLLTVSDILNPEDGVVDFGDTVFYDSMSMTLAEVPLTHVRVEAGIPWTQYASGTVDLSKKFQTFWPGNEWNSSMISSFTMKGLISSWPRTGTKVGSGWTTVDSELKDMTATAAPIKHADFDFYEYENNPPLALGSVKFPARVTQDNQSGSLGYTVDDNQITIFQKVSAVWAPIGWAQPKMVVKYEASRKYLETVIIELKTAQQAIATLPGDDEKLLITMNSNEVSNYDSNGVLPIGDVRFRSYLSLPRGRQSIEHLVMLARANLVARSRAVTTEFQVDLLSGFAASLRKNARFDDPRVPGGEVVGKITGYTFALDGSNGTAIATIKIASTVGYGGAYTPDPGVPSYCEEAYCGSDYQFYEQEIKLTETNDLTWVNPSINYFDDGVDFRRGFDYLTAFKTFQVTNSAAEQKAILLALSGPVRLAVDIGVAQTALQNAPTRVKMKLIPLRGGPFLGTKTIQVSDLIIPKQIDLEAPSNVP